MQISQQLIAAEGSFCRHADNTVGRHTVVHNGMSTIVFAICINDDMMAYAGKRKRRQQKDNAEHFICVLIAKAKEEMSAFVALTGTEIMSHTYNKILHTYTLNPPTVCAARNKIHVSYIEIIRI